MTIEEIRSGDSLQINIKGKVDTFTAEELQNEILGAFQKCRNVVINMEKTEHITSTGLRALLIGEKTARAKNGTMVIINAPQNITDIFRVTGFDNLLTIR